MRFPKAPSQSSIEPLADLLAVAGLLLSLILSVSCGVSSGDGDPADSGDLIDGSHTWKGGVPSGATQTVTFAVDAPEGTERVELVILAFFDYGDLLRQPMEPDGGGLWTAEVSLPQRGLIRYRYEQTSRDDREAFDTITPIHYRHVWAGPTRTSVRDAIAGWAGGTFRADTGTITGTCAIPLRTRGSEV